LKSKSYILVISIFISLMITSCGYNTKLSKLSNEIQLENKKNEELQNNIVILERDKKAIEDTQNQPSIEMNKKGEELIKNLKNMDTLLKIIDAYYYRLDGGPAEGYSDTLYSLYQKEGMEKLIEILNKKDETTVDGVTKLLINGYVFGKDMKSIDNIIEKLNSLNLTNLSNKKKYITLRLLERCYYLKSTQELQLGSESSTGRINIAEVHTPNEIKADIPLDWKAYRYPEYGYEVSYPESYNTNVSGGHSPVANPEFGMRLSLYSNDREPNLDIDSIDKVNFKDKYKNTEDFIKYKFKSNIIFDENIVIKNNNNKIYKIKDDNYYFAYFENTNFIFQFSCSSKETLKKIMSTFNFI
jgi:outer membrane murein-binding lipoprotein Lpp